MSEPIIEADLLADTSLKRAREDEAAFAARNRRRLGTGRRPPKDLWVEASATPCRLLRPRPTWAKKARTETT
jgi:hypothetical protein